MIPTYKRKKDKRLLPALLFTSLLLLALSMDGIAGDTSVDKPAESPATLQCRALVEVAGEVPEEDAEIETALLAQGYFSDDVPLTYTLQDITRTACEEYGVDYALALAVMEQESGFTADAVGWDGHDIGLMQLRDKYHWWLTEETGADPMTPEGNIKCGVWLLGYHLGRHETTEGALTAYRWGSDTGDREYAKAVMEAAERWKEVIT